MYTHYMVIYLKNYRSKSKFQWNTMYFPPQNVAAKVCAQKPTWSHKWNVLMLQTFTLAIEHSVDFSGFYQFNLFAFLWAIEPTEKDLQEYVSYSIYRISRGAHFWKKLVRLR